MQRARRRRSGRPWTHRACAGLALAAFLTATLGFPLPPPSPKDRSRPFPCQDHACGCQSAEECWQHCCCFTAAERWAWAREHHAEPPAYAERPAAGGDGGCCHTDGRAACCSDHGARKARRPSSSPWLAGVAAMHCHGQASLWLAAGAVTPPPPLVTWRPYLRPGAWLSYPAADPPAVSLLPPDPPPRSGCA
jgi:hypothetical protein